MPDTIKPFLKDGNCHLPVLKTFFIRMNPLFCQVIDAAFAILETEGLLPWLRY